MKTLDEAWEWYQSASQYLKLVERLGEHYWQALPWESGLERDERFRDLNGKIVAGEVRSCLAHLNDLAIVVLFSVFESQVRQHILKEIEKEVKQLQHQALRLAAAEAQERIDEGSFFHVLQPFKDGYADATLQCSVIESTHRRTKPHS